MPIESGGSGGAGGLTKLFDSTLAAPAASIDTGASAFATGHGQLIIVYFVRGDRAATVDDVGTLRFNNDSAANYNWRKNLLSNATQSGQAQTAQTGIETLWTAAGAAANIFGTGTVIVTGYDSGAFPTFLAQYGGEADVAASSFYANSQGWYASTTAISRVAIAPSAGNLIAGSRLSIYGTQ